MEPLLERDRDEKKFDIFLSYHRTNLLLGDLKIFLPFTINLDPYIKKVIKGNRIFITFHDYFTIPSLNLHCFILFHLCNVVFVLKCIRAKLNYHKL